jgi:hypothetical protein
MNCRHCRTPLEQVFLDLGHAPPSNAYLGAAALRGPETTFPLRLFACEVCRLVQTEDYAEADALFSADYAYFSSTSRSWLDHARAYADMITDRLGLDGDSRVVEIASNDEPCGRGRRAWAQVLFVRMRGNDARAPRTASIPYGEADLVLGVDGVETLRALGPDASLRVASRRPIPCPCPSNPTRGRRRTCCRMVPGVMA